MEKHKADEFLEFLDQIKKPTWLRHVIIPNINDNINSVKKLYSLRDKYPCIKKIELLPFRKLCNEKYKQQGIDFPFGHIREATKEDIERLKLGLV